MPHENYFSNTLMRSGVGLVLLLLSRPVLANSIADVTAAPPRLDVQNGLYQLWWSNDTEAETITVTMRAQTTGALSFSFAHKYTMRGIDSITGWVNDSTGVVTLFDEWSPNHDQPYRDVTHGGTSDLFAVSGEQVAGRTTIQFSRRLDTGDKYDFPVVPGVMYVVWALYRHDGHGYTYTQHYTYGGRSVDFTTGEVFAEVPGVSVIEPGNLLCILALIALVGIAALRQGTAYVANLRARSGRVDAKITSTKDAGNSELPTYEPRLNAARSVPFATRARGVFNQRVPFTPFVVKHALFIAGFVLLVGFSFFVGKSVSGHNNEESTGLLAAGAMVLVLLPSARWGLLRLLLSASFDQMLPYHYILGLSAFALVTAHAAVALVTWSGEADTSVLGSLFGNRKYVYGLVAWLAGLVIIASSLLTCIRRRFWELFVVTHSLYAVFFVFALLHAPGAFLPYFIIAVLVYMTSKIVQLLLGLLPERTISLENLSDNVVCVTFPKHKTAEKLGLYNVAQHVLINFPAISLFEWHPYSVASAPREPVLRVFIKGLGAHTRQLGEAASVHNRLRIRVDGPYGSVRLGRCPVHVYVAGGIGITPILSILKDVFDVDVPPAEVARGPSAVLAAFAERRPLKNVVVLSRRESTPAGVGLAPISGRGVNDDDDDVDDNDIVAVHEPHNVTVTADVARSCALSDIYLVWTVRSAAQYSWLARDLDEALRKSSADHARYPRLHVCIFVTKGELPAVARIDGANDGTNDVQSTPTVPPSVPSWRAGRPDIGAELRGISDAHPHVSTLVFACGPREMVDNAWDACAAENSRGNDWHVHRELFEF